MVTAAAVAIVSVTALALGDDWPGPPGGLLVVTGHGDQLSAHGARVDVRFERRDAPPSVEIAVAASNGEDRTWAFQTLATAAFLASPSLVAPLVDRPLRPGEASVQVSAPGIDIGFASRGRLRLEIARGRIEGEVTATEGAFAARFAGPIALTCATIANPSGPEAPPILVVDSQLTTSLCAPWASLLAPMR
jgi:hypothetical protein